RRRPPPAQSGPGAAVPHPGGRGVPLPALVGPPPLRHPGRPRRLSRVPDGAGERRPVEPAGPEAARQGAPQPHRGLRLPRSARPVRRPERPAQEELCPRLFLSPQPPPPAAVVVRLGLRPGTAAVPRGRGVLPGLPPDPPSGRPRGPGEPLPPLAR